MATDTKVQPALTPEEWARVRAFGDEAVFSVSGPGDAEGWGQPALRRQGAPGIHALAALCLHGQPFGFTREDARTLRECVEHDKPCDIPRLLHLADRIEALLPPE